MMHLWQIAFVSLLLVICAIHTHIFRVNKPVGPLFHLIWMVIYFVPPAIIWAVNRSYELAGASVLIRFVLYNPVLNYLRHRPFFYLSVNSKNPSLWDKIELKWSGLYPWIWGTGFLGLIIIQFFI